MYTNLPNGADLRLELMGWRHTHQSITVFPQMTATGCVCCVHLFTANGRFIVSRWGHKWGCVDVARGRSAYRMRLSVLCCCPVVFSCTLPQLQLQSMGNGTIEARFLTVQFYAWPWPQEIFVTIINSGTCVRTYLYILRAQRGVRGCSTLMSHGTMMVSLFLRCC